MKILVVSSYLPYPLFSGGHIRLYNILKRLSKHHEVTLVCEKRTHQATKDIEAVEKICKRVIAVERRKQWSPSTIIKTGFSSSSFLVTGHTSSTMKKVITALLEKEAFDLIHVETFYVMQNLPETVVPIVLAEHNIEYLVYQRFADKAPFLLKPLLQIDIAKLKKQEEDAWEKATALVAVSDEEKGIMKHNAVVVPNGVDLKSYSLRKVDKKRTQKILFIGDFKWLQNRDALSWILSDIWPKLIQALPEFSLWIVGRHLPSNLRQMEIENVIFDEHNTMTTSEIFQNADILLAPIRMGGGTSFKILEAMATGVPVVTTPLGIEGIKVDREKDVLIATTAEQCIQAVKNLLANEKVYASFAKNAREKIVKNYNWDSIVSILENVYKKVVNNYD